MSSTLCIKLIDFLYFSFIFISNFYRYHAVRGDKQHRKIVTMLIALFKGVEDEKLDKSQMLATINNKKFS